MSRAESYGAYYRDFRARLLHQTYAYCGNTEIAQRSVSDAFVSAGQHWRKVAALPDRDAWMRDRAFRATGRAQNRPRKPWYVSARSTSDEHRPLIGALSRLEPVDRKLVILRHLVGLDLPSSSREVGVTDSGAESSLEASLGELAAAGVDTSPRGLRAALDRLRLDLADEPVDRAARLRREGNRRRRSHTLLAGISALALAVGAGALTAAQSPAQPSNDSTAPLPATPTAPAEEQFTSQTLATAADVRILDKSAPWRTALTSSDFGDDEPVTPCVATTPTEQRADHYWVRRFTAGKGDAAAQAAEALEVVSSADDARSSYSTLLETIAVCRTASRQLVEFKKVSGLGDQASMFGFRYVDGPSIRDETVLLVRTGVVVETWVLRPQAHAVNRLRILDVVGKNVDALCADAQGACTSKHVAAVTRLPPADEASQGLLQTVDLPVLAGITPGWEQTPVQRVTRNPSATQCDRADFAGAGAADVISRTYVVPGSAKLPAVFGMTETTGRFSSADTAARFVSTVVETVRKCEKRTLTLTVARDQQVSVGPGVGHVWEIDSAASENTTFVFRVALLRVGTTVAQVTFTPSGRFDVEQGQYVALAKRAAQRIGQARGGG
jgi:hypothetical protein